MFAGNGSEGYSGDEGPATNAELYYPAQIFMSSSGNVYIADSCKPPRSIGNFVSDYSVVRMVNSSGIITTVANNGSCGYSGDYGPDIEAQLNYNKGLVYSDDGYLYISDTGNHVIRVVDKSGIITAFAGNGISGYSGYGGLATDATFI